MRNIGINVTHVYGLTETWPFCALCVSGRLVRSVDSGTAQLHSRQGVPYPLQDGMKVLDPDTMQKCHMMVRPWGNHVPWQHRHERLFKEPEATAEAFAVAGSILAIWQYANLMVMRKLPTALRT